MMPSQSHNPKRPFSWWERRKTLISCVLLFDLVLFAFAPALKNDFIAVYDDPEYVSANFHVQQGLTWHNLGWAFTSMDSANWHPLTWLSYMADDNLFGLHPWGYHLVNVLLHATNTVLLFLFLWRISTATWRSFFVAALFGLHPLHVESVAWISERKDVLSAFFGMLALLCYARYAQKPDGRSQRSEGGPPASGINPLSSVRWYLASVFFFACGLMSKPMLVSWPFVLLLLDFWPLARVQRSGIKVQSLILEKWPFFLLSAISSIITFIAQKNGGAVVTVATMAPGDRVENAVVSYARYLGKLFCPINLSVFYPSSDHWPLPTVLSAVMLLVAISVFVLAMRRRNYLLIGWLWFLGTLVPVIGLVQVGAQAMADRYSYLPSIGIFIIAVWGGWDLLKDRQRGGEVGVVMMAAVILACLPLTRRQTGYWADGETLFRHALAVTDENEIVRCQLGLALDAKGAFDQGIEQFEKAIQLNAGDARAYNNLGLALEQKGRRDEAIARYYRAIQVKPDYVEAYVNLGIALSRAGQPAEAIAQLEKALQLEPDSPDAHYNLGNIYVRAGRLDDGIAHFQETIRLNPIDADAHNNLGVAFSMANRLDDAIVQFRTALKLKPRNPEIHNNVGTMFYRKGFWDEAIAEYQAALQCDPNYADAQKNLAMAMRKKNNLLQQSQNPASTNAAP